MELSKKKSKKENGVKFFLSKFQRVPNTILSMYLPVGKFEKMSGFGG